MRINQKVCVKRYHAYARRSGQEKWTEWATCDELVRAMEHITNIRSCGFLAKLVDKESKEVLISDRQKALS